MKWGKQLLLAVISEFIDSKDATFYKLKNGYET